MKHTLGLITKLKKIKEITGNAKLSPQALEQLQRKKLRNVIAHAYRTSSFYRQRMDEGGITPADIKSPDDLLKLPLVTKEEIQNNYEDVISTAFNPKECLLRTTSGSSGKMLKMLWERDNFWVRLSTYYRTLNMIGYSPFKKLLYFLPTPEKTGFTFGLFRQLGLEPGLPFPQIREHLLRFKPDIMAIYPSYCLDLGEYLPEREIEQIGIEAISLNSEMIFPKDRKQIEARFNCPVYDEYSSVEMGFIAGMCREKKRHLFSDTVVAEILDDKRDLVKEGERGELVLTSLSNYAMPMIRYRLGDYTSAVKGTCDCGLPFPLIGPVEGRKDDSFILGTGNKVPAWKIYEVVERPLEVYGMDKIVLSDFYLVQKRPDHAQFYYVKGPDFDPGYFATFAKGVKELFKDALYVEVLETDNIDRVKRTKRKYIHCQLDNVQP